MLFRVGNEKDFLLYLYLITQDMASWRYDYDAHYTCQQYFDNNLGVKSYLKISLNTSDTNAYETLVKQLFSNV